MKSLETLETLKALSELLENKALVYFNELGDLEAYNRIQIELKSVNACILELMVQEQEERIKRALIG